MKVVLYTHRGCPGGECALQYFEDLGIEVEIKDPTINQEARHELQSLRVWATPFIVIGDRSWLGFEKESIERCVQRHLCELD